MTNDEMSRWCNGLLVKKIKTPLYYVDTVEEFNKR